MVTALFWGTAQPVVVIFFTDIARQAIGHLCRGQKSKIILIPEDGTETSVRNYHYWVRNNPEERRSPDARSIIMNMFNYSQRT